MRDLFGNEISEDEARRMIAREKKGGGRNTKPRGYAARPGSGPEGQKCKNCRFKFTKKQGTGRAYLKCVLNFAAWTASPRTDILASAPACEKWQAIPPEVIAAQKELAALHKKCPTGYSFTVDMAGARYVKGGRPLPADQVAMLERRSELYTLLDKLYAEHGMDPYAKIKASRQAKND